MRMTRVASWFLALLAAVPGFAQDGSEVATNRTPAGAQRFLQAVPPSLLVFDNGMGVATWVRESISSSEACKTEISGFYAKSDDSGVFKGVPTGGHGAAVIDWSKVEAVRSRTDGAYYSVTLSTPNGASSSGFWLTYEVEQSRDRAFAAAQYLKDACDRTKETGF